MIESTTFKRFHLIHISQVYNQSNWWDVDQARDWWKRNQGEPFPPYSSKKADGFTSGLFANSNIPFSERRGHLVGLSIFIQIWRWKEGTSSHLIEEYLLTTEFLEWGDLYKPCCEQSKRIFVKNITRKMIFWMEKQFIRTLLWRTTRHSLTLKKNKRFVTICKCCEMGNMNEWLLSNWVLYITKNNRPITQTW